MVSGLINSPMVRDLARTASREIFRGLFGTARRR